MKRKYLILLLLSTIPAFGIARLLQATETPAHVVQDASGNIIPSNPRNLPYKLIGGVPEYVIGVDDLLEIILQRIGGDVVEKVSVRPDGKISFSFLYDIQAAGLTPSELKRFLTEQMLLYIRTPRIEVQVSEYRSKRILVLGAIATASTGISGLRSGPGTYPLKGLTTALSQILEVGGTAPGARLAEVRLTRGGRIYILNLRQALTVGDRSQDVVMENEDILFVPGPGLGETQILVFGQVLEPGVKTLDRPYLLDALTASKGFTDIAAESRVHIIRPGTNPYNPTFFTVDVQKLYSGDFAQNVRLEDGDVVNVSKVALANVNHILSQIGPVLQALTLPATVVSAYTTAFGILPVLKAQNIALQGQTINLLGGGGTGTTPTIPSGTTPTTPSGKPAVPEPEKKE
ncbi:MAG: hypothetical protein EXS64_20090 [Candidatus Latescibacteria bacterium]|nr:hypothetical protein [Candidatus Latescibacterota bacterium]